MANLTITNSTAIGGGNTQQNCGVAYKTMIVTGNSSATTASFGAGGYRRGQWFDWNIGTNGVPADNFMEFDISRITTASTTTSATPQPLDQADAASLTTTTVNSSTFGTITANSNLFYVGLNQRASYRWIASPGGELVSPATSSAGFQLRTRSGGYTGTATGTIHFEEQ